MAFCVISGREHDGVVDRTLAFGRLLEHLLVGEEPKEPRPARRLEPRGVRYVLVTLLLGFPSQVALSADALLLGVNLWLVGVRAGLTLRVPVVLAPAQDHVGLALFDVLAGDLALLVPVRDVGAEGRRGGVGYLAVGDEPGRLAGLSCPLQHALDRVFVSVYADGAVEGLDAGGYGRPSGGGVGDERLGVKGAGLGPPGYRHGVHGELALRSDGGVADEVAVGGAHPVPDEDDDVLRPLLC